MRRILQWIVTAGLASAIHGDVSTSQNYSITVAAITVAAIAGGGGSRMQADF